jgi:HK97 family phage prohead protease/HK97 family phage major capsid protein
MKDKVLHINSTFTVDKSLVVKDGEGSTDSIYIEGYASTNDVDRAGDVVSSSVWETGMKNYLNNPIILANHDYDDPIGRMVEHRTDSKGLWIKARISAAAEIFGLVKDGVVTAFSIGFRIVDAEYNSAAEVFVIKQIELIEISVVSVPCNQNTLFSLSKAFDNAEEYKKFKEQFTSNAESAKGLESTAAVESVTKKEWNMSPEEMQKMLADAAKSAAEEATKALLAVQAKEKADKEAAEKAAKELEDRVKAAVEAQVSVGKSGAERLLEDITKRFEEQSSASKSALEGLEATIKEKTAELSRIQSSKMQFEDKSKGGDSSYADREKAVLLGKVSGKGVTGTRFGAALVEKVGAHLPSATWELEVSLNMEQEVRRKLVVAPLLRNVSMQTNVMTLPVNPEAGVASWVTNAQFGTTASSGGTTATTGQTPGSGSPHVLKEITLNAYKVATNEYLAYEEEEDSLLVIMPIVRDAMVRRLARSVDRAYLLGAGAGADPVKGISIYDATSVVTPTNTGVATIANLRALRKDLGAWGLDPAELVYVVSTEVYYDLLDDTSFQTMAQVGPQATLLTGQVGSLGNTPVLVSAEFPSKAGGGATAATNIGALCFAPGNFLAGNQRGLRFDTQELVESQRRVLVGSLRTGLVQVTTNLGPAVSTLRWS